MERRAENQASTNSCLNQSLIRLVQMVIFQLQQSLHMLSAGIPQNKEFLIHSLPLYENIYPYFIQWTVSITVIYFDGQIVPDLVSRIPFKLAPASFGYASIFFFFF